MNSENPVVTVRISAYNHERYIRKAVLSVLSQTYKDFELIVVDDASTDGTAQILKELAKVYPFTLILNSTNKGLNANNAYTLSIAKGKYIAGLGSDDFWPETRLYDQVNAMEENQGYVFSYGKDIKVNESNEKTGVTRPDGYSGWIFDKLFLGQHGGISATTVMFKTEILRQANVHDKNMYINDKYMFMKVAKLGPILFIDKFLTYYRVHNNHYSGNLKKMFYGKLALINEFKDEDKYPLAIKNVHLNYLGKASKTGGNKIVLFFLTKSLKYAYSMKYWKSLIKYLFNKFLLKFNNE